MLTAAKAALRLGNQVLRGQVGEPFSFGGVTFYGIIGEAILSTDDVPRGFAFGQEHDFHITAPSDAFTFSGLPQSGSIIVGGDGTKYRAVGIENPPGSHKVVILCVLTS